MFDIQYDYPQAIDMYMYLVEIDDRSTFIDFVVPISAAQCNNVAQALHVYNIYHLRKLGSPDVPVLPGVPRNYFAMA